MLRIRSSAGYTIDTHESRFRKRQQAKPFAKKAMERIPSSADPYRQIMRWLLPRIGKP